VKTKYLFLIIFFLALILRIPSFFEPYWYGDEAIRLTVAQNWFSGGTLYQDVYDNAPPVLYLLFGAGKTLLGVKILATIWVLAATFGIWTLAKEFCKKIKKISLFYPLATSILFVILTSTPIFEGNIANGEIFFILPLICGMYLIFENQNKENKYAFFFLAGILFSLASLIKIPSVAEFFAACLFLSAFPKFSLKNMQHKLLPLVLGFASLWLITFSIFFFFGNISKFMLAVFGYNFSYVNYTNQLFIPQGLLILKILIVGFLAVLILKKKKEIGAERSFLFIWLIFSFLGTFLGGRNYPHYLLQTAAPLALILPLFSLFPTLIQLTISLILIVFLWLLFTIGNFPRQRVFSYYQNFLTYASGGKDENSYLSWFDSKTPFVYTLAELIKLKTKPGECVFVYGDIPNFYPLSQRCPATFITTAYHLNFGSHFRNKVLQQLKNSPPPYIVTLKNTSASFDDLFLFLKSNYKRWINLDDATIWQRMN